MALTSVLCMHSILMALCIYTWREWLLFIQQMGIAKA
jgi:hypothetical protein